MFYGGTPVILPLQIEFTYNSTCLPSKGYEISFYNDIVNYCEDTAGQVLVSAVTPKISYWFNIQVRRKELHSKSFLDPLTRLTEV